LAPSIRIGVNCLNVQPGFVGGVNTFTCGLLRGLAARTNGHEFRLFVTSRNQYLFETFSGLRGFPFVVSDDRVRLFRDAACRAALLSGSQNFYEKVSNRIHRNTREMIESEVDVTYTPSTVLHYFDQRKPSILSMHDIQHAHFPAFFSCARKLSRRITYCSSATHATFLQASSNFIKEDLLGHFRCLREERIHVIPEGVSIEQFAANGDSDFVREKYRLPERFLLYPAQMWHHKNHIILLKALKEIENTYRTRIPLVLTGGKFEAAPRIFEFIANERMEYVHYLGKVPLDDLIALYKRSSFLVMPSLYESSSLPILEAAAAGTPIMASDIPPSREFARTLELNLFPPKDVDALAALIRSLWEDRSRASRQAVKNRESVKVYSWENAAEKFINLCVAAASA
jgi:glycosyltransferase involved in cell wall biosynthesis